MTIIGTLPNTISNGQAVDATPVMADFNFIVNQVNANAVQIGTLPAASGTRIVFNQQSAPSGWSIDTSINDHTIQLQVGGGSNVVTTGNGYSGLFQGQWTSDGHALTTAELAIHTHGDSGHGHGTNEGPGHSHGSGIGGQSFLVTGGAASFNAGAGQFQSAPSTALATTGLSINTGFANIQNAGSGNAHSHTKTFNVNYCQCIVGVKT